jgi:hypothetical protein
MGLAHGVPRYPRPPTFPGPGLAGARVNVQVAKGSYGRLTVTGC